MVTEETFRSSRVLVVDDEPDLRELISMTLGEMGIQPAVANDLAAARRRLGAGEPPDLVLADMRLPDGDGLDLVAWMQTQTPGVPVAVITAYGNVDVAVRALKLGAFDFVAKPVDVGRLRGLITSALRLKRIRSPRDAVRLLGDSAALQSVRAMIARVARSQAPVLITGESGTGKELVARMIHAASTRGEHPFAPVNCGAIPTELMESELFGHRRGSFTGATSDRPGLIQSAEGGTVFLDEVSELPLPMQVKLLRAIQERSVRAVGATEEVPVDVRFLSATNRDLAAQVAEGGFREDLYYRLDVISLHVPPLRDRPDDIPTLAEHFLGRLADRANVGRPALEPDALARLAAHPWPGNVRELENVLERAFTLTSGNSIRAEDLTLREPPRPAGAAAPVAAPVAEEPQALPELLDEVERDAILKALQETSGNRTAAAQKLGMSFRQLRYRIAKLGIEV